MQLGQELKIKVEKNTSNARSLATKRRNFKNLCRNMQKSKCGDDISMI